jgi:hypothetical protein
MIKDGLMLKDDKGWMDVKDGRMLKDDKGWMDGS